MKLSFLCLLFLVNFGVGCWSDFHKFVSSLYVVMLLNVLLVPMLFTQATKHYWQKLLGGLSYPIFVCHWLVGTFIVIYVPAIGGRGFMLFAVGTVGSVLFSLLLYFGIDRPVQGLRSAVKKRNFALGWGRLEVAPET